MTACLNLTAALLVMVAAGMTIVGGRGPSWCVLAGFAMFFRWRLRGRQS